MVVASLFEIIPTFLIRSNVPTIASVRPYTPLELAGRDIYVAEGCYNCHSQMIRPIFSETERYGEYSKPGEFVYDRPFQWGSRRIGPDLAREGGKQSNLWHYVHLLQPQDIDEDSVMPSYAFLSRERLDFRQIQPRVEAAAALGAPYGEALDHTEELARAQAKEIVASIVEQGGPSAVTLDDGTEIPLEETKIVALIAYLQRLGTDLYAQPAEASAARSAAPAEKGRAAP